jgi:hypothetical protein
MAEAAALAEGSERPASRAVAVGRLAMGLIQGVVLYFLSNAYAHKTWPANTPALYAALILVFALASLIVIGGLGRIRPAPLAIWTAVAAVVLAVFA